MRKANRTGLLLVLALLGSARASDSQGQMREYIYAGDRLLAVVGPRVTVAFEAGQSEPLESETAPAVVVRVTSLDGPLTWPVTVQYAAAVGIGTATPGVDYVLTPGTLTFDPGVVALPIPLTIQNDAVWEEDETFRIELSYASGAALGAVQHDITIRDDEPNIRLEVDLSSVVEGTGEALINVILTTRHLNATTSPVTFTVSTGDGDATPDVDYTRLNAVPRSFDVQTPNGAVLDPPIRVVINDDPNHEPPQTFVVRLGGVAGALQDAPFTHTVTILDDDLPPTVSINDVTVTEGDGGTSNASLTVSLSASSEFTVALDGLTANGSAVSGTDYWPRMRRLTFAPGTDSLTFRVPVIGDWIHESAEQFHVNLANNDPVYSTIGDGQGAVTIADTDAPGLSVADVSTMEDPRAGSGSGLIAIGARFVVTLSPPQSGTVTVDYMTANGTAVSPGDYSPAFGTLTFPPGVTTQVFNVPVPRDGFVEGPEFFLGKLSNVVGGVSIVRSQGAGWITDATAGVDFGGSPDTDLVWRQDLSGENAVWFMEGVVLASGALTTPSSLPDTKWKVAGTGDFNRNGKSDLLWWHELSGQVVVWHMDGVTLTNGTFTSPSSLPDVNWRIVGTGDFNRNGDTDILWRHELSGQVVVWYMDGVVLSSGTFTQPPSDPPANGWRIASTGDFNRDGKVDILWHNAAAGQLKVWYMNGHVRTGEGAVDPDTLPGPNWMVAVVRDFDRDGKADILWRDVTSGRLKVWYMDGALLTTETVTTPDRLDDLRWRLVGPR